MHRGKVDQNDATFQAYYPMYTLPVDTILQLGMDGFHAVPMSLETLDAGWMARWMDG